MFWGNSKEDKAAQAIIRAVENHWEETEHEGDQRLSVTRENPLVAACGVCGAVLWEEKPDA